MPSENEDLHQAKLAKKDEFYTQLSDIEKELGHYSEFLKGKIVFCNCDDPESSNFWKYFKLNFLHLGLKALISTHYDQTDPTYVMACTKEGQFAFPSIVGDPAKDIVDAILAQDDSGKPVTLYVHKRALRQNGDFRSDECVSLLKVSDVIITNPPFSLFREYIDQLEQYDKKFIIIGNQNAITYKDVFPLIKENRLWLGSSIHSGDREFKVPESYPLRAIGTRIDSAGNKYIRVKGVRWFTNVDYIERHESLVLYREYKGHESDYPKYDNYDAINVDKTSDIPCDYDGIMGVPITFLDKYDPEQFEIVAFRKGNDGKDVAYTRERENSTVLSNSCQTAKYGLITGAKQTICSDGRSRYARIAIQRKSQ